MKWSLCSLSEANKIKVKLKLVSFVAIFLLLGDYFSKILLLLLFVKVILDFHPRVKQFLLLINAGNNIILSFSLLVIIS